MKSFTTTRLLLAITGCFQLASVACAAVSVRTEHLDNDRAWAFKQILRPSRSDAASTAQITVTANRPASSCLSPGALHNGVLPQQGKQLRDFFCFANENAEDGQFLLDLGSVLPVAMVGSYSWQGTTWFDGSRAPQVYTLSGSADGQRWTRQATVRRLPRGL